MIMSILEISTEANRVYFEEYFEINIYWESNKGKTVPATVRYSKETFNSKSLQTVLNYLLKFKSIKEIKDKELENKLLNFINNAGLGYVKRKYELVDLEIEFIDKEGRRFNVSNNELFDSDEKYLMNLKQSLIDSDFDENFTQIDPYDNIYMEEEDEYDNNEEECEENEEDNKDLSEEWDNVTKQDVISFIRDNYPDIDLYETVSGTIYGGRYGQDSLEFREDHLFIFRGNKSLKYEDIKSKNDVKKFINKYLS